MSDIVNRVEKSGIVSLNLEEYYLQGERVVFDLKPFLFQEMIVKEKDFRRSLKELDWSQYEGKYVAVSNSVDAIVPTWAYMLVMSYLVPVAQEAIVGGLDELERYLMTKVLSEIDPLDFQGKSVVVKGCSKYPVPLQAYGEVVKLLMSSARSIMFGEPCSTVPLWKEKQIK
ncbi:MAG: DUF2480 family protein [Lunatimonas sp.]|uniref:DUF2480 family protein n=1 Tax=Lunatimonas sp. TaxID=2060141 RepID=UPI00263B5E80|nr:DUF2480 family protein [Lunatimonas sp.]MCC5937236.1 DUF2480 family protein [Lunatimonas sp.]